MTTREALAATANGLAIFFAGSAGGLAVFGLSFIYALGTEWSQAGCWALLIGSIASAVWLARRAGQPMRTILITLALSNALVFVLLAGMAMIVFMIQRAASVRLPHLIALGLIAALFWVLRRAVLRRASEARRARATPGALST